MVAMTLALVVLALAGVALIGFNPRLSNMDQPHVTGVVTGVVTVVNADGTALCLDAGSSQNNLCYDIWRLRGQPVPAVSDTVTGWVVLVAKGSSHIEQLIIQPQVPFEPTPGIGG
jgi:hypothetical protein